MSWLCAALIVALVAAPNPAGSTVAIEAVEAYVREVYPFSKKVDRVFALHNIECVTTEIGLRSGSPQKVLAFPKAAGAPISYALVRVDGTGSVHALDHLDSINSLFRGDPERESQETARRWAEVFLTIRYFDGRRNQGHPFGIAIVVEPEEVASSQPVPETPEWYSPAFADTELS